MSCVILQRKVRGKAFQDYSISPLPAHPECNVWLCHMLYGLNGLGSLPHLSLLKGTPVLHFPKIKAKGEKLRGTRASEREREREREREVCVVNPCLESAAFPPLALAVFTRAPPLEAVRLACKGNRQIGCVNSGGQSKGFHLNLPPSGVPLAPALEAQTGRRTRRIHQQAARYQILLALCTHTHTHARKQNKNN